MFLVEDVAFCARDNDDEKEEVDADNTSGIPVAEFVTWYRDEGISSQLANARQLGLLLWSVNHHLSSSCTSEIGKLRLRITWLRT